MRELRTPPLRVRLSAALRRRRALWECVLLCGGAALLSAARLLGQVIPLGACLVAAQPFGRRSVSAALGAVAGALLRYGGAEGAEPAALALLMLAAVTVFHGTALPDTDWFLPAMAACVSAILGVVTLRWEAASLCWWCARSLLAGLLTHALRHRPGLPLLAACLAAGLTAWSEQAGLCLGLLLLGWGADLRPLAAVGIALALSSGQPCLTAALLFPALFRLPERARLLRPLLALSLSGSVLALFGALRLPFLPPAAVSLLAGELLRLRRPFPQAAERSGAQERLQTAAQVLDVLHAQLPADCAAPGDCEADCIFDGAAERICRCCPRFPRCWQQNAALTFHALSRAAAPILERGVAQAGDLGSEFAAQCCHLDGFLTAINQELEGVLYRRRYRAQLDESRRVLAESYRCVADFLRAPRPQPAVIRYRPRIGISSAGRRGSSANGDRGCHFPGSGSDYFVLLCDGMGSGAEAAQLCMQTVHLLRTLLTGGLSCSSALRLLNSSVLLRGDNCFATVDLLHLDLHSGAAALYKWGSAPSYLRTDMQVQRLGRPLPPPGVEPGRAFEEYHLSLTDDALLVLVSDGAGSGRTAEEIAAFTGTLPHELAALLLADVCDEDDRTAVVITLRTA